MRTITLAGVMVLLAACTRSAPAPEATRPEAIPVQSTSPQPAPQPALPALPTPAGGSAELPTGGQRGDLAAPTPRGTIGAGSSNPAADQVQLTTAAGPECQTDRDCTCGIDRTTGACAVGPSGRVDSTRQCPDYCGGIDGRTRTVCARGRCTQAR